MKRHLIANICSKRATIGCPKADCSKEGYVKRGYFKTKWNGQPVPRYRCKGCGRYFSSHSLRGTYRQHRPDLNVSIFKLYCSGMSQRRMAIVLGVNRKTVIRKFLFVAKLARLEHERRVHGGQIKTSFVQFDEMETFEHTRLKPLSIALAVRASTGEILGTCVATMNCKGHLAQVSKRKYGFREDTRDAARKAVLSMVKACSGNAVTIISDKQQAYPRLIHKVIPYAAHLAVKRVPLSPDSNSANRKNSNDAMFTLNYTAAKIRHDLSRMARKVWVTTKRKQCLQAHLDLYIAWNNGYRLVA